MFNENICQTPIVAGRVKHIRRKLLAIARQLLSQSVVIGKALQGIGQSLGIVGRHGKAGFAVDHHFGQGVDRGAHHGQAVAQASKNRVGTATAAAKSCFIAVASILVTTSAVVDQRVPMVGPCRVVR